jgi:hypothetical protein
MSADIEDRALELALAGAPPTGDDALDAAVAQALADIDAIRAGLALLGEELHVPGPAPRRRRRRHTQGYIATALVGCVVLVGAIIAVTDSAERSGTAGPSQAGLRHAHGGLGFERSLGGPWSVKKPLIGGRPVSLSGAQAELGQPIPLAQDPLANESVMGRITLATNGRIHGKTDTFVAISYPKSRLAVEYEAPVPYPDAAANYQGYVRDDKQAPLLKHLAYVGAVAGRPALVIHLHADSIGANPASVEFVYRGLRIAVIGYQPSSALLRIATSIIEGGR